jgi:hypothetical protein
MEETCSSETSVDFQRTILRYIPGDINLRQVTTGMSQQLDTPCLQSCCRSKQGSECCLLYIPCGSVPQLYTVRYWGQGCVIVSYDVIVRASVRSDADLNRTSFPKVACTEQMDCKFLSSRPNFQSSFFLAYATNVGPPLWSSGSWLQIGRPGFDSRHYQKKKVVGLERGPLSLVSTTEELLDRKVAAPIENTAVGTRHADHVAPSIRKSW